MGVNLVQTADGTSILDVRAARVTPEALKEGITAHNWLNDPIVGTAVPKEPPAEIVAGNQPVLLSATMATASNSSTLTRTNVYLGIYKAGTYRFRWVMAFTHRMATISSRLYVNGTAVGTTHEITGEADEVYTLDYTCKAGDVVEVYLKGGNVAGVMYGAAGNLSASILWDIDMT